MSVPDDVPRPSGDDEESDDEPRVHEQLAEARVGGTVGEQEARAGRVKEGVLGFCAALAQNGAGGVERRHAQLPNGRHLLVVRVRSPDDPRITYYMTKLTRETRWKWNPAGSGRGGA